LLGGLALQPAISAEKANAETVASRRIVTP
jgi:hypothetical protein